MTERVPFPVPEHVVDKARQIAVALQPHVEDLVVRALTATYREGFADGYLANPANLDEEKETP